MKTSYEFSKKWWARVYFNDDVPLDKIPKEYNIEILHKYNKQARHIEVSFIPGRIFMDCCRDIVRIIDHRNIYMNPKEYKLRKHDKNNKDKFSIEFNSRTFDNLGWMLWKFIARKITIFIVS